MGTKNKGESVLGDVPIHYNKAIRTLSIQIISPTPGLSTTQRILELINHHPQGITVRELSERLNRPVSMINHCLKALISQKQIYGKRTLLPQQWIYYPSFVGSFC